MLAQSHSCLQRRSCWCRTDQCHSESNTGWVCLQRGKTTICHVIIWLILSIFLLYIPGWALFYLQEAKRWLLLAKKARSGCWRTLGRQGVCVQGWQGRCCFKSVITWKSHRKGERGSRLNVCKVNILLTLCFLHELLSINAYKNLMLETRE